MAGPVQVVGGVDPHADTIHVAVLTALGKVIGDAEFPTTADGYRRWSSSSPAVAMSSGSGWRVRPVTVPASPAPWRRRVHVVEERS
jgi:hypothetical protein